MTFEASSVYPHANAVVHWRISKRHADQCPPTVRFDSSKGRGDFKTQIGVGKVIKGMTKLQ
jgi:hypothetical protein